MPSRSTNARFACPEVEWGLTLTNGSSVLLRRLIGDGWARELLLFGAVFDAETALRIGLVTRLVDVGQLEREAIGMAHQAAGFSPHAMRLTKRLLNDEYDSWESVLEAETGAVTAAFDSGDVVRRSPIVRSISGSNSSAATTAATSPQANAVPASISAAVAWPAATS